MASQTPNSFREKLLALVAEYRLPISKRSEAVDQILQLIADSLPIQCPHHHSVCTCFEEIDEEVRNSLGLKEAKQWIKEQ